MTCKHVQSRLSAYIDEELSGQEMITIRRHVESCVLCSEELRCVAGLKTLLGGSNIPEPSAGFEDRLVSRVLAAEGARSNQKKISLITLGGIAAVSMLATMIALNFAEHQQKSVDAKQAKVPYEFLVRDRAYGASMDPQSGSPVMWPTQSH